MPREVRGEHHENDWVAYYAALWRFKGQRTGRNMYLPSPAEIAERGLQVRWLESLGFPRKAIVNIMEYDNPHIDRVQQMVVRHGPEGTYRRISSFFVRTDYG